MSFFSGLDSFGRDTAIIDADGTAYSYRDLKRLCDGFADETSSLKKKIILLLCENRIESIVGYLASLIAGNVALLVDARINRALLDGLVDIYAPDYIWAPAGYYGDPSYQFRRYGLTKYERRRGYSIHPDLSLLLTTSGTTGSPKLVKLTGANLDSNAAVISQYLHLDPGQRPITVLPMHYSYGLSVINSHLFVGATILLNCEAVISRSFWEFFKVRGATSFAGVPYIYEMLKKLRFFSMDLPSLKTMTQAGGRLAPDLVLEFARFSRRKGMDFFVMYGQTEATARISYLPPEKSLEKHKSIGIAIPGGVLTVVRDDGTQIHAPFTEGELKYCGENVMMGYAEDGVDLAKGDELHGVLRTGDIAYFDEDGFFYITGRMKRFIKIFGNRVNLDDVECFLREKGFDCICGGADDMLSIVCSGTGDFNNVVKIVTDTYGFHHSVVKVAKVDEITRSASGKLQYEEIMKRAGI